MQELEVSKKIPQKIAQEARLKFTQAFSSIEKSNLMIRKHRSGRTKTIDLSGGYRIVAKTDSNKWELMTHQKYNKVI